jgi:hypothetical protein
VGIILAHLKKRQSILLEFPIALDIQMIFNETRKAVTDEGTSLEELRSRPEPVTPSVAISDFP